MVILILYTPRPRRLNCPICHSFEWQIGQIILQGTICKLCKNQPTFVLSQLYIIIKHLYKYLTYALIFITENNCRPVVKLQITFHLDV